PSTSSKNPAPQRAMVFVSARAEATAVAKRKHARTARRDDRWSMADRPYAANPTERMGGGAAARLYSTDAGFPMRVARNRHPHADDWRRLRHDRVTPPPDCCASKPAGITDRSVSIGPASGKIRSRRSDGYHWRTPRRAPALRSWCEVTPPRERPRVPGV